MIYQICLKKAYNYLTSTPFDFRLHFLAFLVEAEDFAFGFVAAAVTFFLAGAVVPTTFFAVLFFFGDALVPTFVAAFFVFAAPTFFAAAFLVAAPLAEPVEDLEAATDLLVVAEVVFFAGALVVLVGFLAGALAGATFLVVVVDLEGDFLAAAVDLEAGFLVGAGTSPPDLANSFF